MRDGTQRVAACSLMVCAATLFLGGCTKPPADDLSDMFDDMEDADAEKRYDALKDFEGRVEQGVDKETIGQSIGPLRKALGDADPRVRYRAAKLLSKLEEDAAPAVGELRATLRDPDAKTRYYSAKALAKMGDAAKPATGELIAAMKDADSDVRYFAAKALGKIKATEAVEALERAAESGDAKVQEAAREALAEIRGSE